MSSAGPSLVMSPLGVPEFSLVIPVFNEEESLTALLAFIASAMDPLGRPYEILFIDDGSTDRSLAMLKEIERTQRHIRVFSFRRNLGKSAALTCGFQAAAGHYVLTMDADLQDDPHNLTGMLEHMHATDADIVGGWRRERRDSAMKVVSSKLFNRLTVRLLFRRSFEDMNCGLKLYRGDAARGLRLYGGMHRFIPIIASELGFRVVEYPVKHNERKFGSSKYRFSKIFTEIPDLLTVYFLVKYTTRPLHFFGRVGTVLFGIGFVALVYLTVLWLGGTPIGTRPLLAFGVLMVLIGGHTIFTGLLADLIVNQQQSRRQDYPLRYSSPERTPRGTA